MMKELVALIGPYDENARKSLLDGLKDFNVVEIAGMEEYHHMAEADYAVLRTFRIDRDVIASMPRLKFIQRWGVGYDTVDIEAAGEAGIQVAIAAGVNAVPVAEYTILLMLSVYRNIISIHSNVCGGLWKDSKLVDRSYIIEGKTVGLIGLGAIGKEVAKKARGLGANVAYYDMARLPSEAECELGLSYMEFDALIENADIISLHLPLTENTRNLINKDVLARMKPTSILVNTARGGIVDEEALFEALRDGVILGAGLDVFAKEPIAPGNLLLQLDNIVFSSHSAGNTADNSVNMAKRCVANIERVRDGMPLSREDLVNERFLYQSAKY